MTEVELLEWAAEHPLAAKAIKAGLNLFESDDPINVPLEALEWREGNVQIYAPDSTNVDTEFLIQVTKLPVSVVAIDQNDHKFLARRGDYLVRTENNTYSVLKVGVRRG